MVSGDRMSRDSDGGSCGSNLVLAYYLTGGYGSGHATRALEVVRRLVAAGHDVHVVTAAPEFEVTTDIDPRRLHIRRVDQVVLDSVAVVPDDAFGSKATVPKSCILKREAAWLECIGAVIVMLHPWIVDESSADMSRLMGNVLFDCDEGMCGREDISYAADMDRQMGNAFFDWEGLRGREKTPSPKARSKRSRSSSLPPSPTPMKGAHQKRGSSSPPSADRTKDMSEVITPASTMNHDVDSAGVPIGADGAAATSTSKMPNPHLTKNCRVPRGTKVQDISINIRNALSTLADVDTTAVIQSYGRPTKTTVEVLQSTGVTHFGVDKKKNAADKLMWTHLFKFTYDHQAPALILLITGDGDFAPVVELLETRGYTVLIALPPEGTTSPSLFDAARYTCDWESMARGDGIVFRMPVPAKIETLKAEMIQLYQSKNGHVDMGRIPSEYNKMFNKKLKLSAYNANKLVDLFQKMGDPFSILENKIHFTAPSTSESLPARVANCLSTNPRIPEVLDVKDSDTEEANPVPELPGGFTPIPGKKHRSRWDEMPAEYGEKCNQ